MPDKINYEYAVIRLVPKVEREEFLNIGVLVYSKQGKYLGIKYHIPVERIQSFSQEVDLDLVGNHLKAWEEVCLGAPQGGKIGEMEPAMRFRWLVACRSTIIQSSQAHPGLTTNPEATLQELFKTYVA